MKSAMRPRYRLDFRGLMQQCEANYVRMSAWLPALESQTSLRLALGDAPQGSALQLRCVEQTPYTHTLSLEGEPLHPAMPGARLTVRLYHDVRTAEVIEARPFRRVAARHSYPNKHMHQRDEKLQWNRFLADWLRQLETSGRAATTAWQPKR